MSLAPPPARGAAVSTSSVPRTAHSRSRTSFLASISNLFSTSNDTSLGPASARLDHDVPQLQIGELPPDDALRGGLGRHLRLWDVTLLIMGRIIGTGIFSVPKSITQGIGSAGGTLLLWAVGFVISLSGLLVWIELGCMIPRSGGEKVYLEAMYPRPKLLVTTVFAFEAILLTLSASGCVNFASYVVVAAGSTTARTPEWKERGIALSVITFVTAWHVFFPRAGVKGMNVICMIKISTLLFIVVTGWVVLARGTNAMPDASRSFHSPFSGTLTGGNSWATALFKILNSFLGYTNAACFVNEIQSPVRTLKLAGPIALTSCGILFILANVSYYAAASPQEIVASELPISALFMRNVFGGGGQTAMAVLVAISSFGNVMTVSFAQARVNQELAKEGVIPGARFWTSTWPFGSPSAGLLLHAIPTALVILTVPFGNAYNFLMNVEAYPHTVINMAVAIGFFWLRHRVPSFPRPFRCPWPIAVFFLLAQIFLIAAPFHPPGNGFGDTTLPFWLYAVVGITVILMGLIYWLVWNKVMPAIGRYELVPEQEQLDDGTAFIRYQKIKQGHPVPMQQTTASTVSHL